MNIPARRLACVAAAVSGATALALLATPALAGAAVTGGAEVTASGNTITVEFTDITSDNNTLDFCDVWVTDDPATTVIATNAVPITNGAGTYTTTERDGDYLVIARCSDQDSVVFLTPDTAPTGETNFGDGEPVTLPATPPLGGGVFGSVEILFGSS